MNKTRILVIAACSILFICLLTACSQASPSSSAQQRQVNAAKDAANIRSGYATAVATVMTGEVTSPVTYYLKDDGSVTTDPNDKYIYVCIGYASDADGSISDVVRISEIGYEPGDKIRYVYTPDEKAWTISKV